MIHARAAIPTLSAAGLVVCLAGCAPLQRTPDSLPDVVSDEARIDLPERRVILTAAPATPEGPPSTDIFLVDFDTDASPWRPVTVRRLTDRDGYDNQPHFESDAGAILYTSMRDGQTDIFRYEVEDGTAERLCETSESEYSPTPVPGWPGFSTVRVEADGTQRLWRFPGTPGAGRGPELVFEAIAPVGYHAWIDSETVALFVLGEPPELIVANPVSQQTRTLARDIGRALHRVPDQMAVSYVDKSDPERWRIAAVEIASGERRAIVDLPEGGEDFIWWSSHELLIGSGSKLLLFDLDAPVPWREVADLSEYGLSGISRLSRSPRADAVAVVCERSES